MAESGELHELLEVAWKNELIMPDELATKVFLLSPSIELAEKLLRKSPFSSQRQMKTPWNRLILSLIIDQ